MVSSDEVFYGRRHLHWVLESPVALPRAKEKWKGKEEPADAQVGWWAGPWRPRERAQGRL